MTDKAPLNNTQQALLFAAERLTQVQVEVARRLCSTAGFALDRTTVIAMAQVLATNYLAESSRD